MKLKFLLFLIPFSILAGGTYTKPSKEALELVKSYNKFALESYKKLDLEDNAIYSPYSLAVVLHMASAGAAGETYTEFEKILGLKENNIEQVKELLSYLKKRQRAGIISGQAIALQKDYPIHKDYVKSIQENFFSKAFSLDLRADKENSVGILNDWLKEQTRGMINKAIDPALISESTSHILINTAFFRGLWDEPFPLRNTKTRKFRLENGKTSNVKFMYNREMASGVSFPDWGNKKKKEKDDYRYISLKFKHKLTMDCYLPPKTQTLKDFENSLNKSHFRERKLLWDTNKVFFPKFEFSKNFNCIEALKQLGLKKAFNLDKADFSKLSTINNYIVMLLKLQKFQLMKKV